MFKRPNSTKLSNRLLLEAELMQIEPTLESTYEGIENSTILLQDFILEQKRYIKLLETSLFFAGCYVAGHLIGTLTKK